MSADKSFFVQFKLILKTVVTIVSWILFGILVLIIGFLVYYLIATNAYAVKGDKYEPKFSLYTIVSPSMEPKIKVYDVVVNTRIDDASEIKKGDIITFISTSNISNGMTVTHRVTDVVKGQNGLEFRTKGDNNLAEDTATAKEEDLIGKVVLRLPQLGRLQFFIASNGGWLIVVLIPALFIIVNDIFKVIKLNRTKKSLNELNSEKDDTEKKKIELDRKLRLRDKLNENLEKTREIQLKEKEKDEKPKEEKTVDGIPEFLINDKIDDEKNIEEDNKIVEESIEEKLEKTMEIKLPKYLEEPRNEEISIPDEKSDEEEFEKEKKKDSKEEPKQDKLDNVIMNMIDDSVEEKKTDENKNHSNNKKNKKKKKKNNKKKSNIFDEEIKKDIFSDDDDDDDEENIFIPADD